MNKEKELQQAIATGQTRKAKSIAKFLRRKSEREREFPAETKGLERIFASADWVIKAE